MIFLIFCVLFAAIVPQTAALQSNQTASIESSASSASSSGELPQSTTTADAESDQMRKTDYTGECFLDRNDMCSNHGVCTHRAHNDTTYCQCDDEYAGKDCSHKRKAKWPAFLLAFFLGSFGAGRFYMGYIALGVLKLFLCCGGCCIGFICMFGGALMASDKSEGIGAVCGAVGILAVCMAALGATAWWVADWALILAESLPDAQGFELYSGW